MWYMNKRDSNLRADLVGNCSLLQGMVKVAVSVELSEPLTY